MLEFFIALKYLKEKRKQSILAILGMTLGITVLIISIGISNGLDKNMIDTMLSTTPHIRITAKTLIRNYDNIKEELEKIPGVIGVFPKFGGKGLIKFSSPKGLYTEGIMVDGIKTQDLINILGFKDKIIQGGTSNRLNTAVLGKELADNLGIKPGDKIRLISPENKEMELEVSGIFKTGFYDYDVNAIIVPLRLAQVIFEIGDSVSEIDLKVKNIYKVEEIVNKIDKRLVVHTWKVLNTQTLKAMLLEKRIMVVLLSLILIISGFVIAVVMNMIVKEKTKEIGIMRALGFSKRKISNIFLIQGLVVGTISTCLATLASILIFYFLRYGNVFRLLSEIYYIPEIIPFELNISEFLSIIILAFLICIVASLHPALAASKLDPVEALRYE